MCYPMLVFKNMRVLKICYCLKYSEYHNISCCFWGEKINHSETLRANALRHLALLGGVFEILTFFTLTEGGGVDLAKETRPTPSR